MTHGLRKQMMFVFICIQNSQAITCECQVPRAKFFLWSKVVFTLTEIFNCSQMYEGCSAVYTKTLLV